MEPLTIERWDYQHLDARFRARWDPGISLEFTGPLLASSSQPAACSWDVDLRDWLPRGHLHRLTFRFVHLQHRLVACGSPAEQSLKTRKSSVAHQVDCRPNTMRPMPRPGHDRSRLALPGGTWLAGATQQPWPQDTQRNVAAVYYCGGVNDCPQPGDAVDRVGPLGVTPGRQAARESPTIKTQPGC